ncbi:MAG: hypothetical protein JNL98_36090, partial [Bryobacterales bacterium]|nr:hypothetical protein [Bryobacterales bacterium]
MIEDPNGVAYATTYDYTANGDLKRVTQGSQTRSFGMSSLGRLQTATNPETGMVTYTYDPNGNLVSRVAPKTVIPAISVTTTNTYDPLNRVQKRTYSDAT